jgi:hypothetical protein
VLPGSHLENKTTVASPEGGINWPLNERLTVGLA